MKKVKSKSFQTLRWTAQVDQIGVVQNRVVENLDEKLQRVVVEKVDLKWYNLVVTWTKEEVQTWNQRRKPVLDSAAAKNH